MKRALLHLWHMLTRTSVPVRTRIGAYEYWTDKHGRVIREIPDDPHYL